MKDVLFALHTRIAKARNLLNGEAIDAAEYKTIKKEGDEKIERLEMDLEEQLSTASIILRLNNR